MAVWKSRYARNRARQAFNNWWKKTKKQKEQIGGVKPTSATPKRERRCKECINDDICGLYGRSDDPSCFK